MEWSEAKIATLIDLYREHQCLWDNKCMAYKLRNQKMDSWTNIADRMQCDSGEIQRKMKVILSQYRRERQKIQKKVKSGVSADEVSTSLWIHFKDMQFLNDRNRPISTKDSYTLDEFSDDEHDDAAKDTITPIDNVGEGVGADEKVEVNYSSSSDLDKPTVAEKIGKEQIHMTESSRESLIPQKKAYRKRPKKEYSGTDEAYNVLNCVAERYKANKDECYAFGKFVGCKLRKYDDRTRTIVQQRICKVLFAIDLESDSGH